MEHAVMLAKIFGPVFVIAGLWMLIYPEELQTLWSEIKRTPAIFYFGAMMNLVFGCAILSFYHVWSWHLTVLVTLLGWVMVLRGLLVLFAPKGTMVRWMTTLAPFSRTFGVVACLWGLGLLWLVMCHCH
jgi:uncharacterized protein YjeT (DUF2065 family)